MMRSELWEWECGRCGAVLLSAVVLNPEENDRRWFEQLADSSRENHSCSVGRLMWSQAQAWAQVLVGAVWPKRK